MEAEYRALRAKFVDELSEEDVMDLIPFYDDLDDNIGDSAALDNHLQSNLLISPQNVQMLNFIAVSAQNGALELAAIEYQTKYDQIEAHKSASRAIQHEYRRFCELFVSSFTIAEFNKVKGLYDNIENNLNTSREMIISLRKKGLVSSTDIGLLQEVARLAGKKALVVAVKDYTTKFHAEIAAENVRKSRESEKADCIEEDAVPSDQAKTSHLCADYISREAENDLMELVKIPDDPKKKTELYAIVGEQGTGTTQMALWYIQEHGHKFEFTRIISGDGPTIYRNEMQEMLYDLGIPYEALGYERALAQLKRKLDSRKGWLIVVDNFEKIPLNTIRNTFPKTGGVVLLTSNSEKLLSRDSRIKMEPYSTNEIITLFRKQMRNRILDEKLVLEIGATFGYNPHALFLCSSYMKADFCEPDSSKEDIEAGINNLIKDIKNKDRRVSIRKLYEKSLKKLKEVDNGAAWRLLCMICILNPTGVSKDLVERALVDPKSSLDTHVDAIKSLGLVEGVDVYVLHQLVRKVVLEKMMKEATFLSVVEETITSLESVWDDDFDEVRNWPILNEIGEHVELLWRFVGKNVDIDAKGMLLRLNASFLEYLIVFKGDFYGCNSKFQDLERKVQSKMQSKWKLNLEVVRGMILSWKEEHFAALDCLKTAFDTIDEDDLMKRAKMHHVLGEAFWEAHKYDSANAEYHKSLELHGRHYAGPSESSPKIRHTHREAAVYTSIGICYRSKGVFDKAIEQCEKAVEIETELGAKVSKIKAKAFLNIGVCYARQGYLSETLDFCHKSLDLYRNIYKGDNHRQIAYNFKSVADIYHDKKKYSRAKQHYDRAYDICCNFLGAEHPTTLECMKLSDNCAERLMKRFSIG